MTNNIIICNTADTVVNSQKSNIIDTRVIKSRRRQSVENLIKPSEDIIETEVADNHTPDPIKSIDDIYRISEYYIARGKYRDNMLFIIGINFGLRVSDLTQLRFCQLINKDFTFKRTFPILEKKTKNTRKNKRNRYLSINDAVIEAIILYLDNAEYPVELNDYMFPNESNNKTEESIPMTRQSVDRILKKTAEDLNLNIKIATHSLRKTFGYHQMLISNNDPRMLLLLQKIFGHSTSAQTLDYIGITSEEIEEAYLNLNLGGRKPYLVDSIIEEKVLTPIA